MKQKLMRRIGGRAVAGTISPGSVIGVLVSAMAFFGGCTVNEECVETCENGYCWERCETSVEVEPPITVNVNKSSGNSGSASGVVSTDYDGDGLDAWSEANLGTDPLNPDTDGDGLIDGTEVLMGTSPLNVDSDLDGLDDGSEVELGLDPSHPDTDRDGFGDGDEVTWGSNPLVADTDQDGWMDGEEVACGSSPLDPNLVCNPGTY